MQYINLHNIGCQDALLEYWNGIVFSSSFDVAFLYMKIYYVCNTEQ